MFQAVISIFIGAILISAFGGLFAMFGGLIERKLIGRIHSRYGPTTVGKFGSLQTAADALKFIQKEPFVPRLADKPLFVAAPVALVALAFLVLGFLPWPSLKTLFAGGEPLVFIKSDYDLLAVIALLALTPIIILVGAWASNSKYSALGGFRAISLTLAYEALLFISIAPLIFTAGSFKVVDIVAAQQGWFWFALTQPFALILFMFALIAISERQPLDLPEAESELVQGWLTEYGGPFFMLILLSQYLTLFIIAFALAALFFGGWLAPFGWLGFLVKIAVCVLLFIVSRATYFRLRLDQLLDFSWKFLVPLGFVNFFVTILLPRLFQDM